MLKTALYDYFPAEREKQSGIWGMLVERNLLTTTGLKLLLLEQWLTQRRRSLPYLSLKSPVFSTAETNRRPYLVYIPVANVSVLYQTHCHQSVKRSGRKRARGWRSASMPLRGGAGRGGCARPRVPPCYATQAPATTTTPAAACQPTSGVSSRFTMMLLGKSYQNSAVVCLIDEVLYDV